MYATRMVYRQRTTQHTDTLADLLSYWQRGLLSDSEMVARWHATLLSEEQCIQQLFEVLGTSKEVHALQPFVSSVLRDSVRR